MNIFHVTISSRDADIGFIAIETRLLGKKCSGRGFKR